MRTTLTDPTPIAPTPEVRAARTPGGTWASTPPGADTALLDGPLAVPPALLPVVAAMAAHHPELSAQSAAVRRIVDAYGLAERAHRDQRRASGEPYIVHPLAVALHAAELGMDPDTVAAALCHDVVEDTDTTLDQLASVIGPAAAALVDGVTKLDAVADASKAALVAGSLRKLLLAATSDVRVLVIKLCDRRHNIATLSALRPAKQQSIAAETLEVYVPLAHRLGMAEMKAFLEEHAFAVLHPQEAAQIRSLIDETAPVLHAHLAAATARTETALERAAIAAHVTGREKTAYSVFRKMRVREVPFEQIADLIGLRVVVGSVAECYAALGVLHATFTPVPGRFRDYVALPKWGQYRSLHTTVVDAAGVTVEVQVRTWEMHAQAEFGVAAHWRYKTNAVNPDAEGGAPTVAELPWLTGLLTAGAAEADPEQFLAELRRDLQVGEIVTFTPAGDVTPLPAGASVLDFAYHVHTQVGHTAVAARVNGKSRPLSWVLSVGDRVEVTTDPAGRPKPEWATLVRTSRASHAIRSALAADGRAAPRGPGDDAAIPASSDDLAVPALVVQVRCPDRDGLLAAACIAVAGCGYRLLEVQAAAETEPVAGQAHLRLVLLAPAPAGNGEVSPPVADQVRATLVSRLGVAPAAVTVTVTEPA